MNEDIRLLHGDCLELIPAHSVDATMGVGSTGVVSVSTGRKFVGMELHSCHDQAVGWALAQKGCHYDTTIDDLIAILW